MKNRLIAYPCVALAALSCFGFAGSAAAKTASAQTLLGAVTIADLGVDEPAILVSNPFYSLTNLVRGMKVSFAGGKVGKVSALLDQLDRKAAELIKIQTVAPGSARLISKAITEYQLAVYQYAVAASRLSATDIGTDSHASAFIDATVESGITNLRLIDEVLSDTTNTAYKATLTDMLERLTDTEIRLFNDVVGFDSVRVRILENETMDVLTEIRTAEMFALLTKRAAATDYADAASQCATIHAGLLDAVAADFSETQPDLAVLTGSHAERLQTLSYLLGTTELGKNDDLLNLRNRFVFELFSK